MLCVMQNHMVQAFANSGNAIKPVSFIRDLKSKDGVLVEYLPRASSETGGKRRKTPCMKAQDSSCVEGPMHAAVQTQGMGIGVDTWAQRS